MCLSLPIYYSFLQLLISSQFILCLFYHIGSLYRQKYFNFNNYQYFIYLNIGKGNIFFQIRIILDLTYFYIIKKYILFVGNYFLDSQRQNMIQASRQKKPKYRPQNNQNIQQKSQHNDKLFNFQLTQQTAFIQFNKINKASSQNNRNQSPLTNKIEKQFNDHDDLVYSDIQNQPSQSDQILPKTPNDNSTSFQAHNILKQQKDQAHKEYKNLKNGQEKDKSKISCDKKLQPQQFNNQQFKIDFIKKNNKVKSLFRKNKTQQKEQNKQNNHSTSNKLKIIFPFTKNKNIQNCYQNYSLLVDKNNNANYQNSLILNQNKSLFFNKRNAKNDKATIEFRVKTKSTLQQIINKKSQTQRNN